jgi:hypothetical protein
MRLGENDTILTSDGRFYGSELRWDSPKENPKYRFPADCLILVNADRLSHDDIFSVTFRSVLLFN